MTGMPGSATHGHETPDQAPTRRRLQELAYATAHDLRAPLRGIAMVAEWLEEDLQVVLTGQPLEHLQLLRRRIAHMDGLLTDLARYAAVCRAVFTVEPTDVAALVAEVVRELKPPPGFTIEVPSPLPMVDTASAALKEVLRELIGNAVAHHDRQQGRAVVRAVDAGAFFEFSVADDGPGIPVASHARLFALFHTPAAKEGDGGNGIGLAIVKLIVEDAGGDVAAASDGPRGTRFRFTWPRVPAAGWLGMAR